MRLSGAFNLVLKIVAFGRQKLHDLIDAAGAGAEWAGCVIDRLADLEFMAGHGFLRHRYRSDPPTCDSPDWASAPHSATDTEATSATRLDEKPDSVPYYFPNTIGKRAVLSTTASVNARLLRVLCRRDECFLWSAADALISPRFHDLAR